MFSCLLLFFEYYTLFVLCCVYHTHGKMFQRHLLVFLGISWNTMIVGSSWNTLIVKYISSYVICIMPYVVHGDICAHTHTL